MHVRSCALELKQHLISTAITGGIFYNINGQPFATCGNLLCQQCVGLARSELGCQWLFYFSFIMAVSSYGCMAIISAGV